MIRLLTSHLQQVTNKLRMPLNDNERQELRRVARHAVGRVSERVHFVLMRDQNMPQQQIAEAMAYSLRTVQRALSRYDEDGVEGLYDLPRSGRGKIEPHLNDIIETQAGQPPTVYGYLQTVWTVALLALHVLTRFRVDVSTSTIRRALHAIRFSWHRPKLTPARKPDPSLNKVSHYAHFRNAQRTTSGDPQFPDSVSTDIHTIDGGWVWYIPLSDGIVSVGAVLDAKFAGHLKGPQARFDFSIESCPLVKSWMADSEQVTEMHTISNISYLNDCFVGDGFVMIGDASMFVDPVFSAGVTIAIRGGIFAADAIHDGLVHNDLSAARLHPYEEKIRVPMGRIFKLIRNWYSVLEKKDAANNLFVRSRRIPILRERLIVMLSGGYDKMDLDAILAAAESEPVAAVH